MTWELFIGLLSAVIMLITIGTVAVNVSKALQKNTDAINSLTQTQTKIEKALSDFKCSSKETHKEFYDKLDDHERRIIILEAER